MTAFLGLKSIKALDLHQNNQTFKPVQFNMHFSIKLVLCTIISVTSSSSWPGANSSADCSALKPYGDNITFYEYGYSDLSTRCLKNESQYSLYVSANKLSEVIDGYADIVGNVWVIDGMIYSYRILCGVDFTANASNPQIKDFQTTQTSVLISCIERCHNYNLNMSSPHNSRLSEFCTGVSFDNQDCWMKKNVSMSVEAIDNPTRDSALLIMLGQVIPGGGNLWSKP